MSQKILLLLIGLSGVWYTGLAQESFSCQGQYFLSLSAEVGSPSGLFLVSIDPVSGNTIFTPIATSVGATMNAIGYRKTDNFIYGVNPNPNLLRLYRVGADGVAVDLGVPQGINLTSNSYYAGDITPDGNYLILLGQSNANSNGILAAVDLNAPNYQVTNVSLQSIYGGIFDIAFDPLSGELFGFSTEAARLVKINTTTGIVSSDYPPQPQVNQIGALFFTAEGRLFGYGTINGQNTLVEINLTTGLLTAVASGPPSGGEDGCSCPYNVSLEKTVSTATTLPCTEVVYTFVVNNSSGLLLTGLELRDLMPADFTVLAVLRNPYRGQTTLAGSQFSLTGLMVPPGKDTIQVLVEIGENANGYYENQALLQGLPTSLGEVVASDNPFTLQATDSTPLWVAPLDLTFIAEAYTLCPGDRLVLDASLYGVNYQWEDGSEEPVRTIAEAGNYAVTVTSGCDQVVADFTVTVGIQETHQEEVLFLCESQPTQVDVSRFGAQYWWENGTESPLRIFTETGTYSVSITSRCFHNTIDYTVQTNGYYVNILPDTLTIELGETVLLPASYWTNDTTVSLAWLDPLGNSLSCADCLTPVAYPTADVVYTLLLTTTDGCQYQDQVQVQVTKDRSVYVPNVFSPNGDGINDYFFVQCRRNDVIVRKMAIFDRWGGQIYAAENLPVNQATAGWAGTLGTDTAPPGVYVYCLELAFLDGFVWIGSGDLAVIR
ncbi:MAG: hypothetical protein DA408_12165 [Bacteroidetes bacterium]|nr:MAG: hypothetical protein DA408_12165 [Bacteroidota bacterium]